MKTKIKSYYEDNRENLRTIEKTIMSDKVFVWIGMIVVMGLITILAFDKVEASDIVYKSEICTTDKCKARVFRLNECNGDINCAVKLTQEASYEYLYKELSNLKKVSSEPIKIGLNDAVSFIAKFEGLRLNAYYDGYANNSNRRSIGYGTKSYKGEVITKEEAIKRKMEIIEPLYNSIPSCFNDNQKTALTSYMYNVGKYAMNIHSYVKQCKKKDVEYIMSVYGWNKELIPRRNAELLKFNKQ